MIFKYESIDKVKNRIAEIMKTLNETESLGQKEVFQLADELRVLKSQERQFRIREISDILDRISFTNESEKISLMNEQENLYAREKIYEEAAENIVELKLTCPNCGSTKWLPNEEHDFECFDCGSFSEPENMYSAAESDWIDIDVAIPSYDRQLVEIKVADSEEYISSGYYDHREQIWYSFDGFCLNNNVYEWRPLNIKNN